MLQAALPGGIADMLALYILWYRTLDTLLHPPMHPAPVSLLLLLLVHCHAFPLSLHRCLPGRPGSALGVVVGT